MVNQLSSNSENSSSENNTYVRVFSCLLERSEYNMGIVTSALILYCKAEKLSCLFTEISFKWKGELLLNILLKLFRVSLNFDLTSKMALLEVGGWTK